MTVAELISEITKYPSGLPVHIAPHRPFVLEVAKVYKHALLVDEDGPDFAGVHVEEGDQRIEAVVLDA